MFWTQLMKKFEVTFFDDLPKIFHFFLYEMLNVLERALRLNTSAGMPLRTVPARLHPSNHSRYFYSASSSPLLLNGAPHTARILCRSFTPKYHRQLRVKDLPKVNTWRLQWRSLGILLSVRKII